MKIASFCQQPHISSQPSSGKLSTPLFIRKFDWKFDYCVIGKNFVSVFCLSQKQTQLLNSQKPSFSAR